MAGGLIQSGIEYLIKDSTARGTAGVLGSLGKIEKEVKGVQSMLKTGLAIGLGVLGVSSVVSEIREVASEIDKTAKASDRLGVTTEALTGLEYAASQAGVGIEQFRGSVEQMVRNVSEAAQGAGRAKDSIADLGLSAQTLVRQDPQQMLYDLADALDDVPNRADRVRIAIKLFGASGAEMVNMLQEGSASIRDMQTEADRLGITFTRIDAGQVEAARDAWARMSSVIKGIETRVIIELAPYVEGLAKTFTDAATAGGDFGEKVTAAMKSVALGAAKALELMQEIAHVTSMPREGIYWGLLESRLKGTTNTQYEEMMEREGRKPWSAPLFKRRATAMDPERYDEIRSDVESRFMLGRYNTGSQGDTQDYVGQVERQFAKWGQNAEMARIRAILDTQRAMYEGTTVEQGTSALDSILPDDLGLGTGLSESSLSSAEIGTQWTQEAANVEQAIAKVRQQAEALRQTLDGVYKAEDRLAFADQAAAAFGEGTSAYTDAMTRYGEALDSLKFQEMAKEAQEAKNQVRDMDAALDEEIEILTQISAGHENAAEMMAYEQAVRGANADDIEEQIRLLDRYHQKLAERDAIEFANQQMESLGDTLADIAVDFENAADAAESFLRALAKQSMSEYITTPLVKGIGSLISQWGTAGTATGGTDISSGIPGTAYAHAGGVMGVDSLPRRAVDLSVFAGARRYHTGLMPGEMPAILKRNEGVFTAGQMAALGRGMAVPATGGTAGIRNLSVKISNPAGTPLEAESATMDFDMNDAVVSILLRDHGTGGRTRGGLRR